jgi:hypothetical protein
MVIDMKKEIEQKMKKYNKEKNLAENRILRKRRKKKW